MQRSMEKWQICIHERTVRKNECAKCKTSVSLAITCHWWNLVSIPWCNWLQTVQPQQAGEVWIKPEEISEEAAKFYVTGTDEYTKYLVTEFTNTTVSKVATYLWIGISPQSRWQNGGSKIILPSLVPCGTTERVSQMNWRQWQIEMKSRRYLFTVKTKRWFWFHISTKRNLAKRISLPWRQCTTK